jgi:hypothetical protein
MMVWKWQCTSWVIIRKSNDKEMTSEMNPTNQIAAHFYEQLVIWCMYLFKFLESRDIKLFEIRRSLVCQGPRQADSSIRLLLGERERERERDIQKDTRKK